MKDVLAFKSRLICTSMKHAPDLGLRETICKLAERPWPRGREALEPALLVAWLSTEVTDPIETIETDLR